MNSHLSDKTENPFWHNYIFSNADLKRCTFNKWNWIWLWIFPTFVQCNDGCAFFYKNVNGTIYLIKEEKLNDSLANQKV